MPKPALEEQLEALTRDFVAALVDAIRNASFADVASLSSGPPARPAQREPRPGRRVTRVDGASVKWADGALTPFTSGGRAAHGQRDGAASEGRGRQTAARRAEMAERVLGALANADSPIGVRALSSELGVEPDVLAAPIRELRATGKIRKHGEKRATTYSLA
jgi:hypothetical protein